MARAWRIEYEGALYHVLSRGNQNQDIVINDDDRKLFLDTVVEMGERFKIDLFAYVLMDNHYHLLFRTNRANLCRSMQWFGATYTKRFNLRHHRIAIYFRVVRGTACMGRSAARDICGNRKVCEKKLKSVIFRICPTLNCPTKNGSPRMSTLIQCFQRQPVF